MALNKFMHERNPFKKRRPDFKALALKYDKFRQVAGTDLRGAVTLDFKKPECLQALTWALLKEHFSLDVDFPLDRLIPTVPLRLNYILWLEDLVERREHGVYGIDIGTGASCIYPLVGAQKNHWHFLATETDEMNYSFAKHNVERNGLLDKIQVIKVEPKELLEPAVAANEPERKFDFCMCNPPFFSNNLEAWGMNSRSDDRSEPKSQSTACASESIFPGGEVNFVRHMIADSLQLKDKIRIYTTMLGKKTSVNILKEDLRKNKVPHMATTEFCQGRTMRWGLAWSFDPTLKFPKSYKNQLKANKPLVYKVPSTLTSCPAVPYSIQGLAHKVQQILDELQMVHKKKLQLSSKWIYQATAYENTWSHQRRRRREKRSSSETHVISDINTVQAVTSDIQGAEESASQIKVTSQSAMTSQSMDLTAEEQNSKAAENLLNERNCDKTDSKTKKRSLDNDSGESCDELESKRLKSKDILQVSGNIRTDSENKDSCAKTESDILKTESKSGLCNSRDPQQSTESTEKNHFEAKESEDRKSGDDSGEKELVLSCEISVFKEVSGLVIQMDWVAGSARDSMQQVMQYIKNKIK